MHLTLRVSACGADLGNITAALPTPFFRISHGYGSADLPSRPLHPPEEKLPVLLPAAWGLCAGMGSSGPALPCSALEERLLPLDINTLYFEGLA